jgi:hypothetical protein
MTADDLPTPLHYADTPNTADQLGALCRAQQKMIASLRDDLTRAIKANGTLSGELLEASEARAAALVSLAHSVSQGKELCHLLVHQRDTILRALRSLCAHLANQPITSLTYFGGEAFAKSVREANELLKVIDELQAQQAKQDAKNG